MIDEQKTNENLDDEKTLIEEYQRLQANSISKEEHEKIVNELNAKNKIYRDAILEGRKVEAEEAKTDVPLVELIKDLSSFKGTNLDYWKKVTTAMDKVLVEVPEQTIAEISGADGLDEMIRVNNTMKSIIEEANGNPDRFRELYGRAVVDSAPNISAQITQAGGLVEYLSKKNK